MAIIKYILFFLVTAGIITAAFFVLPNFKNSEDTLIPTPSSTSTPQITSTFSLLKAPNQSLKGQILEMVGKIEWQDRISTEAVKINSPVPIQQGEKLITGENSSLNLVFQDAVSINLAQDSSVDIIQTLPANLVFLQNSGLATYSKIGSFPITVRAKSLLVNIEGKTEVSYDPKKPLVSLKIISGTALLAFNDMRYVSHVVELAEGQQYIFNYDTRKEVPK